MKKKKRITKTASPTLKKKQSSIPTATEYVDLFNTCVVTKEKIAQVDKIIDENVVVNRTRYENISSMVSIGGSGLLASLNQPLFQSQYTPFFDRFQSKLKNTGQLIDSPVNTLPIVNTDAVKMPQLTQPDLSNAISLGGNAGNNYNKLFNDDTFAGGSSFFRSGTVPWYFIACVHYLECSFSFKKHLHNGDPLTAYTVHVPAHRPKVGHAPPFTFEESAVDAIKLMKYDQVTNWSLPYILQKLEGYNGFGYNKKGVHTPYLWSFSNHYTKGKYVKDGVFNADAVSAQMGAAVILKRLEERALIYIPRN